MLLMPFPACQTVQRLSRSGLHSSSMSVMQRSLETAVTATLDNVPAENLPQLRVTGHVGQISRAVDSTLRSNGFTPLWLAEWLSDDVVFLARLFQNVTGANCLCLRLEAVEDNACERFHTDNVSFRLVTTYRGPGTEWLSPPAALSLREDTELPTDKILQLARGHVGIMRGRRHATTEMPALHHRSPQIVGTSITRLFLAIDDAADHEN